MPIIKLFPKIWFINLLVIVLVFVILNFAWAASTPTHDFDDCTNDGTSILTDCEDGGSGWSGNWLATTGELNSETAVTCQSSNCISDNTTGNINVYRTFAAASSGEMSFYFSRTRSTNDNLNIDFCADGTTSCPGSGKFTIFFDRNSPFNVRVEGTANEIIGQYADDTLGLIELDWGGAGDSGCTSLQAGAQFDGGGYSCITMTAGDDPGTIAILEGDGDDFTLVIDELIGVIAVAAAANVEPHMFIFDF